MINEKFEELKRLTLEALSNSEYGSGLFVKEAHYFIAGSSDNEGNQMEFGSYPISLLEEYNKFIEDNLPNKEVKENN